jgi:hypothetical protein
VNWWSIFLLIVLALVWGILRPALSTFWLLLASGLLLVGMFCALAHRLRFPRLQNRFQICLLIGAVLLPLLGLMCLRTIHGDHLAQVAVNFVYMRSELISLPSDTPESYLQWHARYSQTRTKMDCVPWIASRVGAAEEAWVDALVASMRSSKSMSAMKRLSRLEMVESSLENTTAGDSFSKQLSAVVEEIVYDFGNRLSADLNNEQWDLGTIALAELDDIRAKAGEIAPESAAIVEETLAPLQTRVELSIVLADFDKQQQLWLTNCKYDDAFKAAEELAARYSSMTLAEFDAAQINNRIKKFEFLARLSNLAGFGSSDDTHTTNRDR